MCKESAVCRTTSMDEIENFPYEFESISRSVSSSTSTAGELGITGESLSQPSEGGQTMSVNPKTPPLLFNEMTGIFPSNDSVSFDNNSSVRNFSFSPVVMMPVRSESKQSIQDIENLCRSLADSKSTGSINFMTSISISPTPPAISSNVNNYNFNENTVKLDSRPPGITRMPSFGTEFKPAYLYTAKEESQVESLIGLTFDELNGNDVGLSIDSGVSQKAAVEMAIPPAEVKPSKNNSSSSSYLSIASETKEQSQSKQLSKNSIISSTVPNTQQPTKTGVHSKGWHPDSDDIELFDCVANILKSYTLGVKEIIGLRQILRNKFGDQYVNRFNKKLSSKSLLWRYAENENRLKELVKVRARKFSLVVKNETSMFYLCTTDNVPEGFSRWAPRHDPNWSVNASLDNKKGARKGASSSTIKGPQYLDEYSDVTLLSQPSWKKTK